MCSSDLGRQAGKQRLAGDLARGRVQRSEQDELGAGQGAADRKSVV